MRRRDFLGFCACCAAAGPGALFAAETLQPRMSPGFRPEKATDENGLWDQFDKEEEKLKRSRFLLRDPALNAYVNEIVHRVAGDYARDLRVYVVRTPYFNASMAPNGMMQVWSGCLLRCQTEAQLAAVIGHECGHYLRKHGVERFRDAQQKSNLSLFVGLGLSLVSGGGRWSGLADAIILASAFAYSRDQEREADAMGLEMCARAGYDPEEAANVWAHLIAERKARENQGPRDLVFATHPTEEEREEKLREMARALPKRSAAERRGRQAYLQALRREREAFFAEELKLRDYGPTIALFERLLTEAPDDAAIAFNLGEVYRMRAKEGDDAKAIEVYEQVIANGRAPAEAWRSLGLVRRARGEEAQGAAALRRYLDLKPDADDAAMIRSYLEGARA